MKTGAMCAMTMLAGYAVGIAMEGSTDAIWFTGAALAITAWAMGLAVQSGDQ